MLKSNHWKEYLLLMRWHRPIGIYLLLWPTLWGLWVAAQGIPDMLVLFVFVAGVILMRSAGCVINDYADRDFDRHVKRTQDRPLTAGRISAREVLTLFLLLCALAFALVLLLNWFTILLSFVAVILAAIYPFTKRYTYWPQLFLGLAFSWAIPMAFAAQTGSVSLLAWWLLIINLLWTLAYDTLYAMTDREDDLKIGIKSTAILFANADRWIIALLQITVIILLLILGQMIAAHWVYYTALFFATLTFIYQQYLIRAREPAFCFQAFLNNHWTGALIFLGFLLHYLFTLSS
ncbi:4-hydroxybenzoate octaprenyltransferase [Thioflexithrix psekupsensis]|uniref:4-hydroxybenzoate octaprenyltransferase n=1 Tax=Thioflexithrix psekupsensis TaxID=1570016 RepID=A0A251X4Z4_9GAMM|nr:4-hydroxybenzoate octaprenyltransferase [Thioflexithrix psekupsensis]OUD12222.1 4-hydroxybenzoate polyprenyltransferase [Thioflexithrix psekupsensis]